MMAKYDSELNDTEGDEMNDPFWILLPYFNFQIPLFISVLSMGVC